MRRVEKQYIQELRMRELIFKNFSLLSIIGMALEEEGHSSESSALSRRDRNYTGQPPAVLLPAKVAFKLEGAEFRLRNWLWMLLQCDCRPVLSGAGEQKNPVLDKLQHDALRFLSEDLANLTIDFAVILTARQHSQLEKFASGFSTTTLTVEALAHVRNIVARAVNRLSMLRRACDELNDVPAADELAQNIIAAESALMGHRFGSLLNCLVPPTSTSTLQLSDEQTVLSALIASLSSNNQLPTTRTSELLISILNEPNSTWQEKILRRSKLRCVEVLRRAANLDDEKEERLEKRFFRLVQKLSENDFEQLLAQEEEGEEDESLFRPANWMPDASDGEDEDFQRNCGLLGVYPLEVSEDYEGKFVVVKKSSRTNHQNLYLKWFFVWWGVNHVSVGSISGEIAFRSTLSWSSSNGTSRIITQVERTRRDQHIHVAHCSYSETRTPAPMLLFSHFPRSRSL